ncbi:MAG: DUF4259 domain-containing protein [Vulcanimicrobiota bacterium]
MGTWGVHSFQNDSACDWVLDLEDSEGLPFVEETLREVIDCRDYLEQPTAARAVAAAEALACLKGNPPPADVLRESFIEWVNEHDDQPEPGLVATALQALDRVERRPCELLELWEESGNFEDWSASMLDLRQRLTRTS